MLGSLFLFSLLLLSRTISGQNPCPDPEEITPCTCSFDGATLEVLVDCSAVAGEDQIFSAFNNINWFTRLTEFRLTDNAAVQNLLEGVFGEVTFKRVHVDATSLALLEPLVLLGFKDVLEEVRVLDSRLGSFGFVLLTALSHLAVLDLEGNALTVLPVLRNPSLQFLNVEMNQIATVEGGWSVPNLKQLQMGRNPIVDFPSGVFEGLESLEQFSCFSCNLGPTLRAGFLASQSPSLVSVDLRFNDIVNLEPGAITGLAAHTNLDLRSNKIEELTEEIFRPMVEAVAAGSGFIDLVGNPVKCVCSMAWLVLNPDFLASVDGRCDDGLAFQDLDPLIFQELCL
ncbi:unnamed protein product [Darwinula stevensoni]|uniref:Oplophorus-luciferin 2-monooxygenase non-catalytic subunit n=1 Tax=Darwinula stevensoni TaxID=69355 RepID=A0A7R9FQF8_9CRUS|nr:unnamed protein product [Darwinula stevensoni]CAG0899420.1 unnamed protein product [Darwinula stevensoni]